MKKILVLGAAGMAGHMVYTYLSELNKYEVMGTTHSNDIEGVSLKLNIFDRERVSSILNEIRPDYIINCVGMLIKAAKTSPEQTIYTNSFFPHFLKKKADEIGAKLIHISTDCVFSGTTGKYTETSFKDATDVYGLSKNLGEIIDDHHLTIRTSIIGPELKKNGEGLFHWFMNQNGVINGFKSNFWSGVTTLELAKFIAWQLEHPLVGLVHLTNNQIISKYDLLHLFKKVYGKEITIDFEKDYECDKSFINTNSGIEFTVPTYEEMLIEQKIFMEDHKEFYSY